MKKFLLVAVLLSMVMVIPSMVMAAQVKVNWDYSKYSSYPGGEFTLSGATAPSNGSYGASTSNFIVSGSFQTFCLETDEYVWQNGVYDYTGSMSANLGGNGGSSPDPISQGTAFMYMLFATQDSRLGYNYATGSGRVASAGQLQNMIWGLEEEVGYVDVSANLFYNVLLNEFGTLANAKINAIDGKDYGVSVINLWEGKTPRQDQLYYGSGGGGQVPLPPSVYLLGAGLLGLVGLRRRFKK